MRRGVRVVALPLVAVVLLCAPAVADTSINTLLGRQVPARADAPSVTRTSQARTDYLLHCAGCHGADGAGSAAAQVPDLRRMGVVMALPEGRRFLVSVPGVMGSGLGDAQVAGVMNWVLGNLAAGGVAAAAPPYEAAEVTLARSAPLVDVAAERQRLIRLARERGIAWY